MNNNIFIPFYKNNDLKIEISLLGLCHFDDSAHKIYYKFKPLDELIIKDTNKKNSDDITEKCTSTNIESTNIESTNIESVSKKRSLESDENDSNKKQKLDDLYKPLYDFWFTEGYKIEGYQKLIRLHFDKDVLFRDKSTGKNIEFILNKNIEFNNFIKLYPNHSLNNFIIYVDENNYNIINELFKIIKPENQLSNYFKKD